MTVAELNDRYGSEGSAWFSKGNGGLVRLTMEHRGAEAELYLHGAHVTSYRPADGEPVLWMSEHSLFEEGKAIRGGIPVCFPWFGTHPERPQLPSHGFARLTGWQVESVTCGADAVEARLVTASGASTRSYWPSEFSAALTVTLAESLTVALEVFNPGAVPITFTEALHSYFAVSDIRLVTVEGLDGVGYLDRLLERGGPFVQRGDIRFTAETDRPYLNTGSTCIIDDSGKARRIEIVKSGSQTTVVWNPWIAKARRMPDFGDNEWTGMLCVETANAFRNAVTVAPGSSHRMAVAISVTG